MKDGTPYDVAIVGAGVVGSLVARELSRFDLEICLIDRAAEVSEGCSKANSGIVHAGYDAKPGTLKAKLNVQGNRMMDRVCSELSVHFKRIGSLVCAFSEEDILTLRKLYDRGMQNGVPGLEMVAGEKLREIQPNLSGSIIGALNARSAGIICPYGLTAAAAENAVDNGVHLFLEAQVDAIIKEEDTFYIKTSKGTLRSRFLINAAGLYADRISAMLEDPWFSLTPRRGEYMLLDRKSGALASKVLFKTPTRLGKGILATPTVDGNLLIGPTAIEQEDRDLAETTGDGLNAVATGALSILPDLQIRDVITSFAGLRPTPSTDDFIIKSSDQVRGFIHAAGIESPGLSSSPAIAGMVAEILREEGLVMSEKPGYNPIRRAPACFNERSDAEKAALLKENPLHGHIVCRCETVTEAEIVDAIRRSAGARTIDGVKRRVRAGMGRCQGGFCMPRVAEIISRELGIPMEQVTKRGNGSNILV